MVLLFGQKYARGEVGWKVPPAELGRRHAWLFSFLLSLVTTGAQAEWGGLGWGWLGLGDSSALVLGFFAGGFCISSLSSCSALSAPERPFATTS